MRQEHGKSPKRARRRHAYGDITEHGQAARRNILPLVTFGSFEPKWQRDAVVDVEHVYVPLWCNIRLLAEVTVHVNFATMISTK